jgi:membrane-bound serine protease (ClpP class)
MRLSGVLLLTLVMASAVVSAAARGPAPRVTVLEVDGVITPVLARYVSRELERAAEDAELVVVRLDTPGGLDGAMRSIVQAISTSPVPVVVHVAPDGARAASAGMFITLAAHVAAMAPQTAIGAAHPVALGGAGLDDVRTSKVVNDAAALARALAESRRRNAAWAERAVRESLSLTASEAVREGVVELLATDLDALLLALDGRDVDTVRGPVRLETTGAEVTTRAATLPERFLQTLAHPDLAYLLLSLGVLGIMFEVLYPGGFVPGVVGALSLLLGLAALGNLPIGWAGATLLLFGVALIVVEALTPGFGVLGLGGGASLMLGSLLLYRPIGPASPALPDLRPSPWLVGLWLGVLSVLLIGVVRAAIGARRAPVTAGPEALVGRRGLAVTELAPHGTVRVELEPWSAEAIDGPIHAGEEVVVSGVSGVTLEVVHAKAASAAGADRERLS